MLRESCGGRDFLGGERELLDRYGGRTAADEKDEDARVASMRQTAGRGRDVALGAGSPPSSIRFCRDRLELQAAASIGSSRTTSSLLKKTLMPTSGTTTMVDDNSWGASLLAIEVKRPRFDCLAPVISLHDGLDRRRAPESNAGGAAAETQCRRMAEDSREHRRLREAHRAACGRAPVRFALTNGEWFSRLQRLAHDSR